MFYQTGTSDYREMLPGIFIRTLVVGDSSMVCEFRLMQGAVIPAHQHIQEQSGYLISGKLQFFGTEGDVIAEPGSAWNFRGGVQHGVRVLSDSVVIEVFSPVREDYMQYHLLHHQAPNLHTRLPLGKLPEA